MAEESILRIHNPIFYVPDSKKKGPLDGFQAYFGITGRDPLVEANQKTVYALQEDGSAVPMTQPVVGSAGGVPTLNNSNISLAVNGSYSLKILDKNGTQEYYFPKVEAINMQGFSGVIAEESQTVTGSQNLSFDKIETTTASFYKSNGISGTEFEGSYLKKGIDYTIVDSSTLTLTNAAADDTVILGRQMDPTGQIVPITEGSTALFVYQDIASAVASNLQPEDTVTINGGVTASDKLGGAKYLVVFGQPETDDGENYINLDNGNQMQALENTFKLARYSEVTNSVPSVSGSLNLDLNQGNVFTTTLTENIASINFVNQNPDTSLTTTVTLEITQNDTAPYTVTYPGIKWSGGAPAMTATLDAVDEYVFSIRGGTIKGGVFGQDFS